MYFQLCGSSYQSVSVNALMKLARSISTINKQDYNLEEDLGIKMKKEILKLS
jgi:hypothetical protein